MNLGPDINETLARARADLRIGVPVVLLSADGAALVMAAETAESARLEAMRARGLTPVLAITARRAETLKARCYDGDMARIVLPDGADLRWVLAVADPKDDLANPMKGPLQSAREGGAQLHRLSLMLCKAARLLPAALVADLADAEAFAAAERLTVVDAVAAAQAMDASAALQEIVAARVPIEVAENTRLHVFRPEDGSEEHYAIEIGRPDRALPVLTRLHSACFTGDLMGSLKCDCGPQLRGALAQMGAEGAGILTNPTPLLVEIKQNTCALRWVLRAQVFCFISSKRGVGLVLPTKCALIVCRTKALIRLRPITALVLKTTSATFGWAVLF